MALIEPPGYTPAPENEPQRGVKDTFSDLVDDFVTWMANAPAQLGALAANVYNNALEALGYSTAAGASASAAAASAEIAADSAAAAAVTTGATLWGSGQSVAQDAAKISPLDRRTYRRKTATGSGTTDPALDTANYVLLSAGLAYTSLYANEEYASGTSGPTVAAATTTTVARAFNTVKRNTAPGASLSAGQFTLPAGLWEVEASVCSTGSSSNRLHLFCVTDGTSVIYGMPVSGGAGIELHGELNIASGTKVYELRHRVANFAGSTGNLGFPLSSGDAEIYSQISFKKLV